VIAEYGVVIEDNVKVFHDVGNAGDLCTSNTWLVQYFPFSIHEGTCDKQDCTDPTPAVSHTLSHDESLLQTYPFSISHHNVSHSFHTHPSPET
jgi:hypothetical protein